MSDANSLEHLFFAHNAVGITLSGSDNWVRDVVAIGSLTGVSIGGSGNRIAFVRASQNGTGILVNDSANRVQDVVAANNLSNLDIIGSGHVIANVTAANSLGVGIIIDSSHSILMNALTANSSTAWSMYEGDSHFSTIVNLAAGTFVDGDGDSLGIYTAGSFACFTGVMKVGGEVGCSVVNGEAYGITDDCAPADASDFGAASLDIDMSGTWGGKVGTDGTVDPDGDDANPHDDATPGLVTWTTDLDLFLLENQFRTWGADGGDFPAYDNRDGGCTDGNPCRIWDWSLTTDDTGDDGAPVAYHVLSPPDDSEDGVDYVRTHTWTAGSDPASVTFLINAVEVFGDGVGDDNVLCESGDVCLYTPNLGADQGNGPIVPLGTFSDPAFAEDIILLTR